MSIVQTEITLKNADDIMMLRRGYIKKTEVREMTIKALVDTGAWTLVINEAVREKLGLEVTGVEEGTLADGTNTMYNMAGPLEVWWKDRRVILDALVLPDADDVLLGAIPLEAMDLTINPRRELIVAERKKTMHRI
jgi:clan AA aspartic protease